MAPGLVGLPETVEELRHVLGGDSGPVVTDPEMHVATVRPGTDDDARARLGELDRVTDQVFEDLEESVAIGKGIGKVLFQIEPQFDGRRGGELRVGIHAVGNDASRLYGGWFDRESAAVHPRHVEQVLDQSVHSDRGTLDRVYRPA